MMFDEPTARIAKAYSDCVLKDKGMELHFIAPGIAIYRKYEKPPSQSTPPLRGENEGSDPKK